MFSSIKRDYIRWKYGGTTPLEILFTKYPDKPWDKLLMSYNPNITWNIVDKDFSQYDVYGLSARVDLDTIKRYPHLWVFLLSINDNLPIEEIEKCCGLNWTLASANPNLTIDFVNKHSDKYWDWYLISKNKNITVDEVEKHINLPWDWEGLSYNPNLTLDFVERHIDEKWDWGALSEHPVITMDFVNKYRNQPWLQLLLAHKCNMPVEEMPEYISASNRSANPYITMDIVERYPNLEWDWYVLSKHPNFTLEIIDNYPALPWDWNGISANPNLTPEYIENHPEKLWNWKIISDNKFLYDDKVYIKSIQTDMENRKKLVANILETHPKLYKDIMHMVIDYIVYL